MHLRERKPERVFLKKTPNTATLGVFWCPIEDHFKRRFLNVKTEEGHGETGAADGYLNRSYDGEDGVAWASMIKS